MTAPNIPEVFTEQRFNTGELNLNYVVGPDNGPPLVLIPAQIGTWESYHPVFAALSQHFQVYSLDIRGHGKSDWATGDYSWASIGRDLTAFLRDVVRRPAIVSGNSSGGIIALWCAANLPQQVRGLVLEDAPVFSVEWPRFRDRDRFVYKGLAHIVDKLGDVNNRDLADYLRDTELPVNEGRRVKRVPGWVVDIFSWMIRRYQEQHPDQPVDLAYLPGSLRILFKSLSQFDPDFARAFVDGRFYEGLDHAEALQRVRCPLLVLHANWFRHPDFGLVGAMDADDASQIQTLVPQAHYLKIPANHVIHYREPDKFVQAIVDFARGVGLAG